jgi:hypothetical protein
VTVGVITSTGPVVAPAIVPGNKGEKEDLPETWAELSSVAAALSIQTWLQTERRVPRSLRCCKGRVPAARRFLI